MDRRGFIQGLGLVMAAPAIVRASALMPIRGEQLVMTPLQMGVDVVGTRNGLDPDVARAALRALYASATKRGLMIERRREWTSYYDIYADRSMFAYDIWGHYAELAPR